MEYAAQHEVGGQAETPEPPIDGPASRLSTKEEELGDLTEDAWFIDDEPNLRAVYLEATRA